jgi:hypothetical protein
MYLSEQQHSADKVQKSATNVETENHLKNYSYRTLKQAENGFFVFNSGLDIKRKLFIAQVKSIELTSPHQEAGICIGNTPHTCK